MFSLSGKKKSFLYSLFTNSFHPGCLLVILHFLPDNTPNSLVTKYANQPDKGLEALLPALLYPQRFLTIALA
jgi:hypothetical protein